MIVLKFVNVLINGRDRIRIAIVSVFKLFGGNNLLGF